MRELGLVLKTFAKYHSTTTAVEALEFLQSTTLKPRGYILLLADKVSKATDAQALLNRIGAVLDSFGNVDVVVSSLSPHLIYSLATVSQSTLDNLRGSSTAFENRSWSE